MRELEEETGLKPDAFYSADTCKQFYEADRDAITMAPVFVAFVDADAEVTLNHEHSEFRWVTFDEAVERSYSAASGVCCVGSRKSLPGEHQAGT